MGRYQFGLGLLVFLAHFGGIAARAFAFDPGDAFHEDRLCTQRQDLFPGRAAHVGCAHLRAEAPRGRDGLQARNADPHDKALGGGNRACRRHHHRKGAAIGIGRFDHRLVSGEVRLAGEDVHALRARDARHEFHRERFKASRRISIDPRPLAEGIKPGNDPGTRIGTGQRRRVRPLHAQDNVRALDRVLADLRARSGEILVRDGGAGPRPWLDRHAGAQRDEFLHRFRAGRDAGFPARGFFQDRDPHWPRIDQEAIM